MIWCLFEEPADAVAAARKVKEEFPGVGLEVFSPYHLHDLDHLLDTRDSRVSLAATAGGLFGGGCCYGLQYLTAVHLYPFEVSGTPPHAWPSFLPVTFEMTVLGAALSAFFSVLIFCGLPRFHHPVFGLPEYSRTTLDRFALLIDARDNDESVLRGFLSKGSIYAV